MTIVRYWTGEFSLFYTIRFEKIKQKCEARNEKNLSSGSSEILKNEENALLNLG